MKLEAEAKKEKEKKALESALRKKELQDCDKVIDYGTKLTEVSNQILCMNYTNILFYYGS